MQCHGISAYPELAHYIWNSYPVWQNIYGAVDDRLDSSEKRNLKKFKKTPNDRYSLLFSDSDEYPYILSKRKKLDARPNLLLTKFIAVYQAVQVADVILSATSNDDRHAFQQERLASKPLWPNVVSKGMDTLHLTASDVLLLPSDPGRDQGYILGSPSFFGSDSFGSMVEFQLFKLIYGEDRFERLLGALPSLKPAKKSYKLPDTYISSLAPETLLFLNSNIYFKGIWWDFDQSVRQRAFFETISNGH
jgi:hypothetical protein